MQQRRRLLQPVIVLALSLLTIGNAYAEPAQTFDFILRLILRGDTLYDGSRRPSVPGDVGIAGDKFAAVGDLASAQLKRNIEELIELCKVAAEYDGLYIPRIRSEGNLLLEAVDELLPTSREQPRCPPSIAQQARGGAIKLQSSRHRAGGGDCARVGV